MTQIMQKLQHNLPIILEKHIQVPALSVAIINENKVFGYATGVANTITNDRITKDHFLECASLSKTVASAFAIEYFNRKGIPLSTPVNHLLSMYKSKWFIDVAIDSLLPQGTVNEVRLTMLMNHTALGMHYVFGFSLDEGLPPIEELLDGTHAETKGYKPLYLERIPGEKFAYSGGGFIVLQYLLELMERKPIEEIYRPYLDGCGMTDFTFHQQNRDFFTKYAFGHFDKDNLVRPDCGGRLSFPPLAAGGLCTASSLAQFLSHLSQAYSDPNGSGSISHSTARFMLSPEHLVDLGAIRFMNALAGCGVFVATAGPNRIMLHQAANDGFRGVYMVCFDGPDRGKGVVMLTNGDNPSVYLMCEAGRYILSEEGLNFQGVDFGRVDRASFSMDGIPQEVIVNLGLKELLFNAFVPADEDTNSLSYNSKL